MLTPEDAEDVPKHSLESTSQFSNTGDVQDYNACLAGLSKSMDELEQATRIAARRNRARHRRVDDLTEDDFRAKVSRVK